MHGRGSPGAPGSVGVPRGSAFAFSWALAPLYCIHRIPPGDWGPIPALGWCSGVLVDGQEPDTPRNGIPDRVTGGHNEGLLSGPSCAERER